ncbi:MAG: hypothetical protein JWN64_835 [Parcubacteria group bacterium]|nr:hypothetical protein [Parcubacteria group bacterium]
MPRLFLTLLLIVSITFPFSHANAVTAKDAFPTTVTADDLVKAYQDAGMSGSDKFRILIVPGHEPDFGGAQFGGFYERELVVDLSKKLAKELETDPRFEVILARDTNSWSDALSNLFDRSMKTIKKFVDTHKKAMAKLVKKGKVEEKTDEVQHAAAPTDVALRLYGVSKWANDNDIDLMIHVHLNDETNHAPDVAGTQSGFAIYVPDEQYGNAEASKAVADSVFNRLHNSQGVSTLPLENAGVVEDQELIALGAFNTSEVPSMLIEYGYIYEPRFLDDTSRSNVFSDFAYQTTLGIRDFLGAETKTRYDTRALPYTFSTDILASTTSTTTASTGVYALQASLHSLNFYPEQGKNLTECPISGFINTCTTDGVRAFQMSKGIDQTGALGPATRNALNMLFSATPSVEPVPAATSGTVGMCAPFTYSLKLDSTDAKTGGEVSKLQTLLAKDSSIYPEGKVTGNFGPATDRALKLFQVKNGIAKAGGAGYGLVGPMTRAALLATCK